MAVPITTIKTIVESMELSAAMGLAGALALLAQAGRMAGRLFFTASGLVVWRRRATPAMRES